MGTPTLITNTNLGDIVQVPIVGIEYIAKKYEVSRQDFFETPKQRFINLLTLYNGNKGSAGIIIGFDEADIEYIDTEASRQNWESFAPRPLHEALKEVNDREVQPAVAGGTFKDKFFDFTPDPTTTKKTDIEAREFGGVSSGVVIDAETITIPGTPQDQTGISDDIARRNLIVYKFHPAAASIPMEKTRFESKFAHARLRPEWDSGTAYLKGDLVKFTQTAENPFIIRYFEAINNTGPGGSPDGNEANWREDFTIVPPWTADAFYEANEFVTRDITSQIRFYRSKNAVGPSATAPEADATNWEEKFVRRASSVYNIFVSPSPWTNNLDALKQNMHGLNNIPATYVGYMPDWNKERALYDRKDFTSEFKHVTGKDVRRQTNTTPTGRELFHGARFLVGTAPTGAFSGNANKIAQYVRLPITITAHWEFSDTPVEGDTIFNDDTAEVWAFVSGSWVVKWTGATNNDKSSPYHLVKSIKLVADKNGIPGQAVQLTFNWKTALFGGDDKNRTSRGLWYRHSDLAPDKDGASTNIGALYGGDGTNFPPLPFFNSVHLDANRTGIVGWNRGLDSEDHGRVGVHLIALKAGFFRSTDDSILTKGKANIAFMYWRRDWFGRYYYFEFTVPRNNEWHVQPIPIPPAGDPSQLYFNRLDELATILGYTIPFTFGLPEKEFSGVRYSHRFSRDWGVFMKDVYTQEGFYTGSYDSIIASYEEAAQQIFPDILELIDKIAHGDWANIAFTQAAATTDHAELTIGNLYYEKEGYALSQDAEVAEPMMEIIRDEVETDYLNAKTKALAWELRKSEINQIWHFIADGDVRLKAGQTFVLSGSSIPGGSLTLVCQQKKDIIDNDSSYTMEITSILKRETPL